MDRQETFNSPPLFCICHQKFSILSLSFLPLPLFEFFLFFMCSTIFLVSLVMSFSFRVFGVSPGIMAESSHDCHQYIVECVKLTSTQLDSSYHSQTFSSEIGRNHFWNWVALWHSRFMRGLCDLCVIEALELVCSASSGCGLSTFKSHSLPGSEGKSALTSFFQFSSTFHKIGHYFFLHHGLEIFCAGLLSICMYVSVPVW